METDNHKTAIETTKPPGSSPSLIYYSHDLGDSIKYGLIDTQNPSRNYEFTKTKEQIQKEKQELKDKVKVGNYYSYDGIEYVQEIETEEEVLGVMEDIEDGLCSEIYTLEEIKLCK